MRVLILTQEQKLLAAAAIGTLAIAFCGGPFKTLGGWLASLVRTFASSRSSAKSKIRIAGVDLSDEARLRHTHIVGATGSGKTVLIEQLLFNDLARGLGALVIDPKGDREFYERLRSFCKSIGRESDLHLLSASRPEETVRWNP